MVVALGGIREQKAPRDGSGERIEVDDLFIAHFGDRGRRGRA
jgi:hypothetical protein